MHFCGPGLSPLPPLFATGAEACPSPESGQKTAAGPNPQPCPAGMMVFE
jgi:hypothetical protein